MEDLFKTREINNKKLRLNTNRNRQWVEGAFVAPDIDDEHVINYANTDGFLGKILSTKRIFIVLTFIVLGLSGLMTRAAHLQIVQGAEYISLADENRLKAENVRADRGLIYDRFQKPLVRNVPNYVVTLLAQELPEDEVERNTVIEGLYNSLLINYLQDPLESFQETVQQAYNDPTKRDKPLILAEHLKQDHAVLLQVNDRNYPGVKVEKFSRREYITEGPPTSDSDDKIYSPVKSLSHILGYTSSLKEGEYGDLRNQGYLYNDVIGRSGLESSYEEELRGTFGIKQKEVDSQGREKRLINQNQAVDGQSLVTSIDLELQRFAEQTLQANLDEEDKKKGSVVILDPNNGQILAMVSLPTYDNNHFAVGISSKEYQTLIEDENFPLFNRSISGEYPSGSTFKPIVAAAALEEGIVTPNTSFLSTGGIRISSWFFPDWRAGGHGQTNLYHALSDSVNTYFYIIGGGLQEGVEGLGVARITDYAHQFGLSQAMGIDLPGERAGFLPSKEWKEAVKNERWYIGDTYHLAIGQGDLLVTPLQMAMSMTVFANGGTLYQPTIVKGYFDEDSNQIAEVEPLIKNEQVVAQETIQSINDGLRRVVTTGSGRRLGTLEVAFSAKTGTAQWHSEKDPHSWFVGYGPTENPQVAFSVLVEEGVEGSGISLTVAKDILQWWLDNRYAN